MSGNRDNRGFLWKLPEVRLRELGKVGPAFGIGAGCGVGFGVGLLGGVGLGPGIPGLQLGFGVGAGCGVGIGFGYGLGMGVAHDDKGRHSNVGKFDQGFKDVTTPDDIGALVDEMFLSSKKLIEATSREFDKWRK